MDPPLDNETTMFSYKLTDLDVAPTWIRMMIENSCIKDGPSSSSNSENE